MTVKELIKELQKCPKDFDVVFQDVEGLLDIQNVVIKDEEKYPYVILQW